MSRYEDFVFWIGLTPVQMLRDAERSRDDSNCNINNNNDNNDNNVVNIVIKQTQQS